MMTPSDNGQKLVKYFGNPPNHPATFQAC